MITALHLTSPDTVLRRRVSGPDLLTPTGTIHFRDLLQGVQSAAPD
ncbi:MAG: hypothetical protein ACRDQ6_14370 [Pseudonocardiaceae bacterium]